MRMDYRGLHVRIWGISGPRVLFLHGSTADNGEVVWRDQRPLSGRYRLIVPDRRGYGDSPFPVSTDWEDHITDVVSLLEDGAHLVGHSYGAVLGLIAGTHRPDLIRSLTLIEPPAFGLARGVPAVEEVLLKLMPLFAPDSGLSSQEFGADFVEVISGRRPPPVEMSPRQRAQMDSIRYEPAPWTAPIELDTIAAAPFPRLVVSGAWHPAFSAVCDTLAERLEAEHLVLPGFGHGPHHVDGGVPLNGRLLEMFDNVEAAPL